LTISQVCRNAALVYSDQLIKFELTGEDFAQLKAFVHLKKLPTLLNQ